MPKKSNNVRARRFECASDFFSFSFSAHGTANPPHYTPLTTTPPNAHLLDEQQKKKDAVAAGKKPKLTKQQENVRLLSIRGVRRRGPIIPRALSQRAHAPPSSF